jgi:hypothetical protein
MKLINMHIKNFRSIIDSGQFRLESLQSLVGENNAGKSNILYAIQLFLTTGASGIGDSDFYSLDQPIIITGTFGNLNQEQRNKLRTYLIGDKLILEKKIIFKEDPKTGKLKAVAEYHGYMAKPKDWWLSIDKIIELKGARPKWEEIGIEHGIIDYVRDAVGRVNKSSYEAGIRQLIMAKEDIEFEEPELGQTQALGIQQNLLSSLPNFHLLPAITDYSDETDKRASTTFRRLMGDLSERILRYDPRFSQIEATLKNLKALLNPPHEGEIREEGHERLNILEKVETKLQDIISKLMPSVCGIRMEVIVEETKELFSRGVSISVNDGKFTDVLMKGHGLQRCIVFGLLQALILNQRGQLIPLAEDHPYHQDIDERDIIMSIEEPELYIHPQMQRLIYKVLEDFSVTDQVIYTTHSPMFVDISKYESIAVVRKESLVRGTKVCQCGHAALMQKNERKTFQFLSSFGLEQNQMFFAKKVILVEGEQDIIAILATGRHSELFKEFPEEIGYTIIASECKNEMIKYIKLLNAFMIPYVVLHENDGNPELTENKTIEALAHNNKRVILLTRLEDIVAHYGHFGNNYKTKKYFENNNNITEEIKRIVKELFT